MASPRRLYRIWRQSSHKQREDKPDDTGNDNREVRLSDVIDTHGKIRPEKVRELEIGEEVLYGDLIAEDKIYGEDIYIVTISGASRKTVTAYSLANKRKQFPKYYNENYKQMRRKNLYPCKAYRIIGLDTRPASE